MARTVRDAALRTRETRLKLKVGKRYWRSIHEGLALCYRRGKQGSGTWSVRLKLSTGGYALSVLGTADDHSDANSANVLTFAQAQTRAVSVDKKVKLEGGVITRPATVAEATERYLNWFRKHRKSIKETEHSIRVHILPALGAKRISDLKAAELRQWHENLAAQPARIRSSRFGKPQRFKLVPRTTDEKRARRATANRILNVLKAILNRAFQDGLAPDDRAWRRVLPFENVDEARIRFLTDVEAIRLVNACANDLRPLVRAALLTGARYGELTRLCAQDFNFRAAKIYIAASKSGKSRYVSLNSEGLLLFKEFTAGKLGNALIFQRFNGRAWGKNHHIRSLQKACSVAKIRPGIAFHQLRHSYASALAQAGVDLLTISKLLGHADTRITSKHYAHLADKTLADAVAKLPSFKTDRKALLTNMTKQRVSVG